MCTAWVSHARQLQRCEHLVSRPHLESWGMQDRAGQTARAREGFIWMTLLHLWGEDQGLHGSSKDHLRQDICQSGFSTASSSDRDPPDSWIWSQRPAGFQREILRPHRIAVTSTNSSSSHWTRLCCSPYSVNSGEFKGQQSEIHSWRVKGHVLYESGIMFTRLYRKPLICLPLPGLKLKISGCTTGPWLARNLWTSCHSTKLLLKCSNPDACFPGEPEVIVFAICVVFQMAAAQWGLSKRDFLGKTTYCHCFNSMLYVGYIFIIIIITTGCCWERLLVHFPTTGQLRPEITTQKLY